MVALVRLLLLPVRNGGWGRVCAGSCDGRRSDHLRIS